MSMQEEEWGGEHCLDRKRSAKRSKKSKRLRRNMKLKSKRHVKDKEDSH